MENIVPTVGIVLINSEKVLLVRHKPQAEHLTDAYGLPAGRLNENEAEIDAAVRELKEETGLETSTENLIALPNVFYATIERKDGIKKNFSFKVFLCNNYSGKLSEDNETIPEWVAISDLKNKNLLPNVENAINDALKMK